MIRVLVWAKPAVMRAGLEAIVLADARLELVGAGSRTAELASALRQFAPDVVLLDAGDTPATRLLTGPPGQNAALAFVVLMDPDRRSDV